MIFELCHSEVCELAEIARSFLVVMVNLGTQAVKSFLGNNIFTSLFPLLQTPCTTGYKRHVLSSTNVLLVFYLVTQFLIVANKPRQNTGVSLCGLGHQPKEGN